MKLQTDFRAFARYTLFSVFGTLGVSCYILADTFFISKGLGTNGLAALNLAIPVYNFIHGIGQMLGMGGATKFSISKSQGDPVTANHVYTNTLYLAAMFSVPFMLLGFFGSERLALLLGADAAVLEMTDTYLFWLLAFSPAFILNEVFLCFVRNDEGPQLAMTAMLTGSFANILLDYVFIFPLEMGIFGAIFASGLSPLISIVMMTPHWTKKKNTFHPAKVGLSATLVRWELSLGFPSLIAQVSSGIVMICFNIIILNLEGNTGVAAYGVIANIALVITAIYTGIAQGVQPLISRSFGMGKQRQMQTLFGYAMLTTLALSCALYLFILAFAQPVTAVFNSENSAALQAIAVKGLRLYFISSPFAGYNILLATYFTSIEKALPAHILSLLRGFVIIIPAAFLLAWLWGMTGVWLTYPMVEAVVALPGFAVYRRFRRGTITPED